MIYLILEQFNIALFLFFTNLDSACLIFTIKHKPQRYHHSQTDRQLVSVNILEREIHWLQHKSKNI